MTTTYTMAQGAQNRSVLQGLSTDRTAALRADPPLRIGLSRPQRSRRRTAPAAGKGKK